jgi:hypothetical protein
MHTTFLLFQNLPDIVAVNSSVRPYGADGCGDPGVREFSLVEPGGYLAIDEDPQKSAWRFRGPGTLLWEFVRRIEVTGGCK